MEYEIFGHSMDAASEYAQFNNSDHLLLGHEIYMPEQSNNGALAGAFDGGNVNVDTSAGHSTSASTSRQQFVQKKKGGQSKRSTTKLSVDPQSVAARQRRHRISKRFRILQTLVPGGTKMDTASMLDEAIQYVKFLKYQIWFHEMMGYALRSNNNDNDCNSLSGSTGPGISPLAAQMNSVNSYGNYNPHAHTQCNDNSYTSGNWGN